MCGELGGSELGGGELGRVEMSVYGFEHATDRVGKFVNSILVQPCNR